MIFGLESLGVFGWILVIIMLLIFFSLLFLCCTETDDDFVSASRNRNYEKPYDPKADGTVDMAMMLYSSHYYNIQSGHHSYCDFSDGWGNCGDVEGGVGDVGCGGDGGDCG